MQLAVPTLSVTASGARAGHETDHEPELDGDLVRRAQLGDVEAFAVIYDRHAPRALALAARMLMSRSDAEDVLQEVFLEAWQSVRDYDAERASVRTWLLVRMRSRALDRLSRRTREELLERALQVQRTVANVVTAPDDRSLTMRNALDRLDEQVRCVLELAYFWGLTAPEIGTQLQLAEGTVRSRLARGLRGLERLLSDTGASEHGS